MRNHPAARLMTACLAIFIILSAGCANNSTITHSYVDPSVNKLDLEGVLVVGVAKKKSSRVTFEEAFAKTLTRRGVRAIASHTLVADMDAKPEQFLAAAEKANLDTILVTRFIGKNSAEVYHPGTVYYDVMPAYGGYSRRGFGGYYGHAYEVAYDQPVWSTNTTYTLISDLFATGDKSHLWQAVSDTIQAGNKGQLQDDVIKSFVDDMNKNGLLD